MAFLYQDSYVAWRSGVGRAERQVLWLLARICEYNRPFFPLKDFSNFPFKREFNIFVLIREHGYDFSWWEIGPWFGE